MAEDPRDISRWLRAVRPDTTADHDWADTAESTQALTELHHRLLPSHSGRTARRSRMGTVSRVRIWLPATAVAATAAVVVALTWSGGVSGTGRGPVAGREQAPTLPAMRPAAMLLSNYSSCNTLLAGLRSHTAGSVTLYGLPGQQNSYMRMPMAGVDNAAGLANAGGVQSPAGVPAAAASGGTSTTNDQEQGVDEPDVVKTEGNRVVTITDGVLHVLDAATGAVTGTLDLTMYQGATGAQLLVSGDQALVLLSNDNYSGYNYNYCGPIAMYRGGSPVASSSQSTYLFVDLAGQPVVTGSLRASGGYLDARLVGSTVRLVVDSAPVLNLPAGNGTTKAEAAMRKVVNAAPLSAWLPKYTLTNGTDVSQRTVPCDQVSHPTAYTGTSLLSVYTLDLTHLSADPAPITVAADGDTVYATADSLYVASNPNWYCCTGTSQPQDTELHRFDITGSAPPRYLGSASVPGRLLSSYSLSDFDGHLRIATTSGQGSGGSSSSVYVLDSNTLTTTGHVDGLGTNEQIYAVRFIGPLAYVVTFKQTDPLYVVDLHDPSAPKVVGMLKLTGYSDYLHDAGNGMLIGVGQQASPQGRVAGLQVSLFDVTNPAAPVLSSQVIRSDAVGEQTLDPHQFLYWPPTGLVVVPLQGWSANESGKVLVLKVTGTKLTSVGVLANPTATSTVDDGLGIQRSLLVDGALWTVSGGGVQISDAATLHRQAWVPFG